MNYNQVAFIALGSNQGESVTILNQAFDVLEGLSTRPLLKSGLWRSMPVDCPPGSSMFVNAAVGLAFKAGETPETLLARTQKLERVFGRKPKVIWNEPRPLDLDLITFGFERRETSLLTLPHPRAVSRCFVLAPLAEIAPDLIIPGQPRPVHELLAACQDQGCERIY